MSELFAGVDLGASATKVALIGADGRLRGSSVLASGADYAATAQRALDAALAAGGAAREGLRRCVATGYGRHNVPFAHSTLTEISCQALACRKPRPITLVDIGGQDSKVIRLDGEGRTLDFRLNRKCAAGTGSFLEEVALRLGLALSELEPLASRAGRGVTLSSFCTVFAKTELLSHLRRGVPAAELARGAMQSVVERVLELSPVEGEVWLTGGVVAHNPTVARLLGERLGREVLVPEHAQHTAAIGAALRAREEAG